MDENRINVGEVKAPPSREMRISAWLMYAAAYIYIEYNSIIFNLSWDGRPWDDVKFRLLFVLFVLIFVGITELILKDRRPTRESFFWLSCMGVTALSVVFKRGNAFACWYNPKSITALFAVWWVLSRSGALISGESSGFLPFDALNGFVGFPFKHFFLRIKTVWTGITGRKKYNFAAIAGGLVGGAVALGMLIWAFSCLTRADTGFERASRLLSNWLDGLISLDVNLGNLLFSLPVGAYLFGLIGGASLVSREALDERKAGITAAVERLRIVPEKVWLVSLGLFVLMYLGFFCLQFSYLFGAFVRRLPEGFVVAEYARQGFFELCRVMGINFALLWLVSRTSLTEGRAGKIMCSLLMACSMVFAVIALSKLYLYISCFGFTPKRLQSTWLALLLLCGSICAVYSMWTGKKSFKAWMLYGGGSLALLCLV